MKNKLILIVSIVFISFTLGITTGTYKHFPYNIIIKIKRSLIKENVIINNDYPGRNYNLSNQVKVDSIEVTEKTGIYLTYGQSNSVNSGELGYTVKNKVYQSILGHHFLYKDPSLGGNGNKGSVWGMVGDKLIQNNIHDKVIFSNCGWGGKKINELRQGPYLGFLILNYQSLIKNFGKVDGILYHQGESDNGPTNEEKYYNEFVEFIQTLKTNGINIPVYLSRVSYCGVNHPINNKLTEIQTKLINDFEIIKEGPNTDLLSDKKYRLEDNCHFSLLGYDKFSDMWVQCLSRKK
jgi:hypothetical protein